MAFIAAALPYLAAAGAAVSAYGALQSAGAQASVANYNAQVEANRATEATQYADAQAKQTEIQNKQRAGEQASAYAAGGVDMSGSPLDVMYSTAQQGELSAQLQRWQGKTQATAASNQGVLDTAAASSARSAGLATAGSTLLTAGQRAFGPQGGISIGAGGAGTSPAT